MKSFILLLLCTLGCEAQMLWFEPNWGQANPDVHFLAHTRAGYVYLNRTKMAVGGTRMDLAGANTSAEVVFEEPTGDVSSYFTGREEKNWRTGIPHYRRVRLKNVYAGIDLIYYVNQASLEYDFIVRPEGDPREIRLAFDKPVKLASTGDLLVGGLRQHKAQVYQGGDEVGSEYVIGDNGEVRLALADYDRSQTLTIDPVLEFSTYIGGPGRDGIADVKVDGNGFIYLAGNSQTPQSPVLNPFQQANITNLQTFVLKFSADGQRVIYFAVVGGTYSNSAQGIVVDSNGSPTIMGLTVSTDFPVKNAFQPNFRGGLGNVFVTRLTPDGRSLIFSTYLGGSGQEIINPGAGAAIDSVGNVWVTGYTSSPDFPVKNPVQASLAGNFDLFVAKFSPQGALLYSTYYGGAGIDSPLGIAVDSKDNVYLTGVSTSADFPLKNAIQTTHTPVFGFSTTPLFALSADGQTVLFSTYLGGTVSSNGGGLAFDDAGNIYIVGWVHDSSFRPTPDALQPTFGGGGGDAFLIKLDPKASKVLYSTYFGGSAADSATDVKVDANGYIYIAGTTASADFPAKSPLQQYHGGGVYGWEDFVVKIAPPGKALVYSTPFGGSTGEGAAKLALAPNGAVYLCGTTGSYDFPVKNAFQPKYGGGGYDGYLALISDATPIQPSPLTPSPGTLSFRYVQGGTSPPAQIVQVAGGAFVGGTGTPWITLTALSIGSAGVAVNAGSLNPGTYTGSVILAPAAGTPATVSVTLTVFAPAPIITSIDPAFIAAGSNDTIISIHGAGFTANTSIIFAGTTWTVTPVQFVDGSTLKVDMPPSVLTGAVIWSIAVQNPQSQSSNAVPLSVGVAAPSFTATSVVNAGSFAGGPVAPGEIITIFGSNLTGNVTFDNIPATIVYSSATQISATVPYTVLGPKTSLQIGSSVPISLDVAASAPGIFAAVANGDGTLTLYATGCGSLSQDALPVCQLPVTATINGKPAQVLYAGAAPGLVQGANQINLMLPSHFGSGPINIVLTAGAASSKSFSYSLP